MPKLIKVHPEYGAKHDCCNMYCLHPDTKGCTVTDYIYADGVSVPRVPYENEFVQGAAAAGHRCHDCGCLLGEQHHPGCDMEVCGRCGGQLISCACELDEDQHPGVKISGVDMINERDFDVDEQGAEHILRNMWDQHKE